ncbi:MAG: RnfABCDGE type electron transport complex subunit D [Paracoccaceae bacterium]|nr:RnfABCDGE type electron transport complex subunit D [Paracoccaceae bacterium]
MRGLWTHATMGWIVAAALLPPTAVMLVTGGAEAALRLAAGLAATLLWQFVFRLGAGVPLSPSGAVTALALALFAPEGLAPWQIALGASFGLVLADLVFGGWGRNVISAPATALAFLFLSYPALPAPAPQTATALAALASGLLLALTGILSWRVTAAALATAALILLVAGTAPQVLLASGAFAFGLVFVVADPSAAACTPKGRWFYGALAGGLAGLLAALGPGIAAPQPIVFAALLAQVFAPLIDHLAVSASLSARARRLG